MKTMDGKGRGTLLKVAFSLLIFTLKEDISVKGADCISNLKNLAVYEGTENILMNLAANPNDVQWRIFSTSEEIGYCNITDYGGYRNPKYVDLFDPNPSGLVVLKATSEPPPGSIATSGLYMAQCANSNSTTAAKLIVVRKAPECTCYANSSTYVQLSSTIHYTDITVQPINAKMTWMMGDLVIATITPQRLRRGYIFLESTSTISVDSTIPANFTCVVTFNAPTEFQYSWIVSNAPQFSTSCTVEVCRLPSTSSTTSTTIPLPNKNTTIELPNANTTTPIPTANTTTPLPDTNITIPLPNTNITLPLPTANTTISLPNTNTTVEIPNTNITISLPNTNTTTQLPKTNITISLPNTNTTTQLPNTNTTAQLPNTNITISLPNTNTTTQLPNTNITISFQTASTTTPLPNATTLRPSETTQRPSTTSQQPRRTTPPMTTLLSSTSTNPPSASSAEMLTNTQTSTTTSTFDQPTTKRYTKELSTTSMPPRCNCPFIPSCPPTDNNCSKASECQSDGTNITAGVGIYIEVVVKAELYVRYEKCCPKNVVWGVVVTLRNGSRWLIHDPLCNDDKCQMVVVDASCMSNDWNLSSDRNVVNSKVGDYVQTGNNVQTGSNMIHCSESCLRMTNLL